MIHSFRKGRKTSSFKKIWENGVSSTCDNAFIINYFIVKQHILD